MGRGAHGGGHGGPYSPLRCFGNIFIAFVGAGVLGMPYAFSMAGVLESCVILTFAGVVCTKGMLLLVDCKNLLVRRGVRPGVYSPVTPASSPTRRRVASPAAEAIEMDELGGDDEGTVSEQLLGPRGRPCGSVDESDDDKGGLDSEALFDYGDIAMDAAGTRGWWVTQVSIVSSQVGFCCAYLIFITHNVSSLLPSLSPNKVLVMLLLPQVILVNIRDLSRLGPFSLAADAANVFAYCVVFFFDYARVEETGLHGSLEKWEGFPFFLGVAIYCYEGAGMVIALETSVPKEHRDEFPKIFKTALAVITLLYMFFGASGYISYGSDTQKIITLNMPEGPFPAIVKGCLCFSLFFTYPVMMFPVSALLDKIMGTAAEPSKSHDPSSQEFIKGSFMRACLVLTSGVVVVAIPDFAAIMGLIGSTCCMLLALILPGYFHLKIFGKRSGRGAVAFDLLLIGLGVVGMALGTRDAVDRIMNPDSAVDEAAV